jgi:hypothetical protein
MLSYHCLFTVSYHISCSIPLFFLNGLALRLELFLPVSVFLRQLVDLVLKVVNLTSSVYLQYGKLVCCDIFELIQLLFQ